MLNRFLCVMMIRFIMAVSFLCTVFAARTTSSIALDFGAEGDNTCANRRGLYTVPRVFWKKVFIDSNAGAPGLRPPFGPSLRNTPPKAFARNDSSPSDLLNASALHDRAERLLQGKKKILFQQTDMEACEAIVETGFRLGSDAHWGPAIYGTTKRMDTFKLTSRRGCMIKYEAKVGAISDHTQVDAAVWGLLNNKLHRNFKGPKLIKKGIDSVHACWAGMDEWIVYFADQTVVLEACPIDNQGKRTGPCIKKSGSLSTP